MLFFVEIKNHPYFEGIDWESVAERKSKPLFDPIEIQINENDLVDLTTKLNIDVNEEIDGFILERLRGYD